MIMTDTLIKYLSKEKNYKRVILHVCRNPSTGVWAMMKELSAYQQQETDQISVLGVLIGEGWAQVYRDELKSTKLPYLYANVPYHSDTIAYLFYIFRNPVRRWCRLIRDVMPDAEIILHFHSGWTTGGFFPLPTDRQYGIISTFHGIADDHRLREIWWLRTAHRFLSRRLLRSDTLLTAVSQETTIRAEKIFGIPRNAFTVVPNGMAAHTVSQQVSSQDEFVVGHVGQMHEGKGWHLLIGAIDQLRNRGIPVRLLLAGAGQDSERVRLAAKERSQYMQFLGLVPNAGKTLIPQLDALVLATWSEGMPMTIIESFAAGVPVLATRVGGIPEMIEDGVNGLFIERDFDSISRAIERLVLNPELVNRLSKGANNTFVEKFNISIVAAKYDRVYDQALGKNLLAIEPNREE